ncbi:MAG: hypothetical protein KDC42_05275 [Ignavibacteriae bacterium]|nr:hypothetical protein [Ignavibacteriota bacterium]
MKDKNNLLTSMIIALLAGLVYYLAGADSIEKFAPQFGLIESNTGKDKSEISVVFSKADSKGEKNVSEQNSNKPVRYKIRESHPDYNSFDVELTLEEKELASSSDISNLEFSDAMDLLKKSDNEVVTSLHELVETGNEFEMSSENNEELDRPAIAWTQGENSHSLETKVKTKTTKIYSKAKAAVYLGEGDIMTGKLKFNKKTDAGNKKTEKQTSSKPNGEVFQQPTIIDGTINFIPDAKETKKNSGTSQSSSNVIVNTQTKNGVSFIVVKTNDDDGNCTCKVQCKNK